MGEVEIRGHIIIPASTRCISFLFHVKRSNRSYAMTNSKLYKKTNE